MKDAVKVAQNGSSKKESKIPTDFTQETRSVTNKIFLVVIELEILEI